MEVPGCTEQLRHFAEPAVHVHLLEMCLRQALRVLRVGFVRSLQNHGGTLADLFPADDRVFSITVAVPLAEPRLKVLAKAPAFDALVHSIGALARWVAPQISEPIGDPARPVQAMGGLINRLRRFVDDDGPLALRFFVLGDAAYCTNPLYGRGCSQGMLHAHFLGEAIDQHGDDWAAIATALDQRGRDELEPYYRASIMADPSGWLKILSWAARFPAMSH